MPRISNQRLGEYTRQRRIARQRSQQSQQNGLRPCSVIINRDLADVAYYARRFLHSLAEIERLSGPRVRLTPLIPPPVPEPIPLIEPRIEIVPNRPFVRTSFDAGAGTSSMPAPLFQIPEQDDDLRSLSAEFNEEFLIPSPDPIGNRVLTPPLLLSLPQFAVNADQVRNPRLGPMYRSGLSADRIILDNDFPIHSLGDFFRNGRICRFCNARYFQEEQSYRSRDCMLCCQCGKIVLPPLTVCPAELRELLLDEISADAKHYRKHIRHYNSSLAFASTVGNFQNMGVGPEVVKVNGVIHHIMPQVLPRAGIPAKFGQLYFLDTDEGVRIRASHSDPCLPQLLESLDVLIRRINPFTGTYRMLKEVFSEQQVICEAMGVPLPEITLAIAPKMRQRLQNLDPNRYNVPTVNEIAAVFVGNEPPFPVDVRLYPLRGDPITLRDVSALLEPLSYPLLFPFGELGWTPDMEHQGPNATRGYHTVTCREYACYRLAVRHPLFSILHHSCKLFLQWIVDTWCRIEGLNLFYIRSNQRQIQVENYAGLRDFIARQAHLRGERIGRMFILPSTFTGSPRYMQQKYMDAMAIVAKYGKPDLFLTITCNPRWQEITECLEPGQQVMHRPDLVCRIFYLKLQHLLSLLLEKHVFGRLSSLMYVIEFQKRGLPHAHILMVLDRRDRLVTPEQVDSIIRAELPHPRLEKRLFELVTHHLLHKQCGQNQVGVTCMRDGKCRWNFPKPFLRETEIGINATYAKYRRRDDGRIHVLGGKVYTNQNIVPYSPMLLNIFQTHINLEMCTSIRATKYLYNYIHKGHDGVVIDVQEGTRSRDGEFNWDEIEAYQECRYVSAHEACWRIFGFPMSYSNISVFLLHVHLPDQQNIYFQDRTVNNAVNNVHDTHLTAWFKLNQQNWNAHRYLYEEIVQHFTWQRQRHCWTPRLSHFNVIGRLPDISPKRGELYYFRILLSHIRGATGFGAFRVVHGQLYPSYRAACLARHLIQDDLEYMRCMREAAAHMMPSQLRRLFACLLLHCDVQDPVRMWHEFFESMSEDLVRFTLDASIHQASLICLQKLNHLLLVDNKTLTDFHLPLPDDQNIQDILIANVIPSQPEDNVNMTPQHLNAEQEAAFVRIFELIHHYLNGNNFVSKCIFIDGPAGTGKTFFYNYLIRAVEQLNYEPVAVAFTGIAAILLKGGTTSHNQFGLPLNCTETASSYLKLQDPRAVKLQQTPLIIWDEASMTSRYALECADKFVRFLSNTPHVPFGGKVLVLGGDFRQLLPVCRGARRIDIVNFSVKSSNLWPYFISFNFTENMRTEVEAQNFANTLLEIGEGRHDRHPALADEYFCVSPDFLISREEIIDFVFGNDPNASLNEIKAILTPRNDDANFINEQVLTLLNFPERRYVSVDTLVDHNQQDLYISADLLHQQNPIGCPQHILVLKENAIIMLLRNMDIAAGLCNGTRLRIIQLGDNVITAEIITGSHIGNQAFIPRFDFHCDTVLSQLPFKFIRRQFPIKLSYAMTINKAQGQTLDKVALYLPEPVFAHGQFYVALSRVRRSSDIKICVRENMLHGSMNQPTGIYTKNIVYPEIL